MHKTLSEQCKHLSRKQKSFPKGLRAKTRGQYLGSPKQAAMAISPYGHQSSITTVRNHFQKKKKKKSLNNQIKNCAIYFIRSFCSTAIYSIEYLISSKSESYLKINCEALRN